MSTYEPSDDEAAAIADTAPPATADLRDRIRLIFRAGIGLDTESDAA